MRRLELAQAINIHLRESAPESFADHDPAYQSGVLATITAVLDHCLDDLEDGLVRPAPIPLEVATQVRRAARVDVSLGTVLRRYVAGYRRFGEFVAEAVKYAGYSDNSSLLHQLHNTQELLLERLTAVIEHEYMAEREIMISPVEQRQKEIVKRLLANQPVDFTELAELSYEFHSSWHLGLIAIGAVNSTQGLLWRIKANLDCALLRTWCSDEMVWVWFGVSKPLKITDVEHLLLSLWTADGLAAVGGLGRGLDGWRQTHLEARGALLRSRGSPHKIVQYAEQPLLVAALESDTLATWLRGFLAPIRDRPDGGASLLETLRAYIDTECNRSSAAALLKVRRQTVGTRLRMAETLIERPLATCLAEIDVALHLLDLQPDDAHRTLDSKKYHLLT